jgi:hypothetical protein
MSAIRQATLVGLCLVMAALPAAAQSGATATRTKPAKRALYECMVEAIGSDSIRETVDVAGKPRKKGEIQGACEGKTAEALFKAMNGNSTEDKNAVTGIVSRRAGKALWCAVFPLTPPSYSCTFMMEVSQPFVDAMN